MANNIDFYLPGFNGWDDNDLLNRKEQLPYMKSMILNGSGITDRGLSLLKECKKLRELHLTGTSVTNKGMDYVSQLDSLDWLVIDGGLVSDRGIKKLSSLGNLKSLQLIQTMVSDKGINTISNFSRLDYLEAVGENLGEKSVSVIAGHSSLTNVRIGSPQVDDDAFLEFASSTGLRNLVFDFPKVSRRAAEKLQESLPHCLIRQYSHFANLNRFKPLVETALQFYEEGKYTWVLNVLEDAQRLNRSHPVVKALRAFAYLKLGRIDGFRDNMKMVLDIACCAADHELAQFARYYLDINNYTTLSLVVAKEEPHNELRNIIDRTYRVKSTMLKTDSVIIPGITLGKNLIIPSYLHQSPDRPFEGAGTNKASSRSRLTQYLNAPDYDQYINQPKPELVLLNKIREMASRKKAEGEKRTNSNCQLPWQW